MQLLLHAWEKLARETRIYVQFVANIKPWSTVLLLYQAPQRLCHAPHPPPPVRTCVLILRYPYSYRPRRGREAQPEPALWGEQGALRGAGCPHDGKPASKLLIIFYSHAAVCQRPEYLSPIGMTGLAAKAAEVSFFCCFTPTADLTPPSEQTPRNTKKRR